MVGKVSGMWSMGQLCRRMDVPERPGQSYLPVGETAKPKPLHQVAEQSLSRLQTGIREFDRVLGGRDCSRQPGFVGRRPALASRLCFWMPA